MHLILFIVFAALCLTGAVNLLLQRHPINSALSLIVVMTSLAVLYLLLGAEFLAAAQIIVYAGAIMVLFTFVVMLLNAGLIELYAPFIDHRFDGCTQLESEGISSNGSGPFAQFLPSTCRSSRSALARM